MMKIRTWFLECHLLGVYWVLVCSVLSLPSCGGGTSVQLVSPAGEIIPLKIVTTQLASGMVGHHYSFQMQSSGGGPPYTWSLALGHLPPGVSLNATTGVMAGMPIQAGKYSFTIEVSDSTFNQTLTAIQSLNLIVTPPPLTIVSPTLPDGRVGAPYHAQLQAIGGTPPYIWLIVSGSLASGVELNAMTGEITGTPTLAGTSTVTIQVTDSSSPQYVARLMLGERKPDDH